jgi:glycine/D-amino acid oxidase-like deaminating enzyme
MPFERAKPSPLWWDAVPTEPTRPPLPGDTDADVCIVGAGFTGLWTAYYLKRLDPGLRVIVLEREHVGFGASGRNGGWCHGEYPLGLATLAHRHGAEAAVRYQRAAFDAVHEVGRVVEREGFDAQYHRGGRVLFARSALQAERARADVAEHHALGLSEDDIRFLDEAEAAAIARIDGVTGASFTPDAAAVHPALLVHGLAAAAERLGVVIHEGTAVTSLAPKKVETLHHAAHGSAHGTVRADVVLRATEGYTRDLPGERRTLIPLYSLMLATEPLPGSVWDEIGFADREVFADYGHMVIYGQRTQDGRFAFGGRGAPYHWRSGIHPGFDVDDTVHGHLERLLVELFPSVKGRAVTHRWGGPLGVPRDWRPTVRFDPSTGFGYAGGYVGDGVALSNLAGHTLAELVLERASERTELPWVQHRWRKWEPEPLRYLGVNAGLWLTRSADREEARTGRPSLRAKLGNWIRGKRH